MKRTLLFAFTLAGIALVAWSSRSEPSGRGERNAPAVPHHFGGIHPRISPDGRQIVCSYQGAIWRLPRDGSVMTRLTDTAGFDMEPAWSPDAKRIAFVSGPRFAAGDL